MAAYGYSYRSFSTYNTVRGESQGPKPFVPFIPNTNTTDNSEAYVTKKTIVPVARRSYDDDDDYKHHHSSPRSDHHDQLHDRHKSPVQGSSHKVDDFPSKVARLPTSSYDHHQSPKGYGGDHGSSNKEGHKPIGDNTIRNGNHDGYNYGPNGYANYVNKEGHKPIASPIRNDHNHDGYNGPNGNSDYKNKEGQKPIASPIRNGNHYDGYNYGPNGYGDYGSNKEGYKPIGDNTTRNGNHEGYNYGPNGYGDYKNKDGHKPIASPIRNDHNYDGYNYGPNGYGDYKNKEGHKPIASPIRNDHNYDGYNYGPNGYGDYGNYNNKEGQRPIGTTPSIDNYGGYNNGNGYGDSSNYNKHKPTSPKKILPSGWTGPKFSTAWTAPPRKGTQLSEPTNDIDKAMQLLKEAAMLASKSSDQNNKGGHKSIGTTSPNDNYDDNYHHPSSKIDKSMDLVREAARLKNIVTGSPRSRSSVPIEPPTPNKDEYGESIDGARRYGKSSLGGSVIDSWEAEKKYKGKRV